MNIKLLMVLIGVPLFVISAAGYIFVKLKLKPDDREVDDYNWEVEERQPGYTMYNKLSQLTFGGVIISMLLLFLALAL